ncbi:MAG: ABC transporter permease, partial [Calditrichaeota bacterium]|nr:ABC transporter permease [Calditrichota bacterium]
ISPFMAKKLGVKVRSKVILRFQDYHGDITSAAFRVVGIFKLADARSNKLQVFVDQDDLRRLAGIEKSSHEILIKLNDINLSEAIASKLQAEIPENLVQYWGDIAPELKVMSGYTSQSNQIFMSIVMLALLFGIMNTMLMSVLERVREFGTLIALGMNHARVFIMVMIETLMLSLVGAVVGIIIAYITMIYLSELGIDLSNYSDGLSTMGLKHMIYPDSTDGIYTQVVIFVSCVAMISAIYPGIKASRLEVTDAIRSL